MLRAARRYADEDARRAKSADIHLYLRIAEEQYRAGLVQDARATLSVATGSVRQEGDCPVSSLLVSMARVQWQTGGVAEASATMKTVLADGVKAPRLKRRQCLEGLAVLQEEIGDLDGAIATAALFPGARKTSLYPRLANDLARNGRLDAAVAIYALSSPLPTDEEKAEFRLRHRPGASRWDAAESLAKRDPRRGRFEFSAIAEEAALSGDSAEADKALARVVEPDSYLLGGLALSRARHGDISGAIAFADSKLAKDPDGHSMALIRIAVVQARAGDDAAAEATRKRALEISSKTRPDSHLHRTFLVLAQSGRVEEALALRREKPGVSADFAVNELFEEGDSEAALKIVEDVGFDSMEAVAVHGALNAYIRKGDFTAAIKALTGSAKVASIDRDEWLAVIAEAQARAGDMRGALETVRRLEDGPFTRRPIAIERVAQGQMESLEWSQAPDWIAGLQYPDEKARAWLGAAKGMRLHEEILREVR